ncbi:hypothetical protein M9Y10_000450 [Tritrichomonas musculus]|uniref:Longin domain-containing protein n=1 Tax=Tritrichomonas musculus TaxID=1915356 RepID=A0ABR2L4A3_9EUKA
MTLNFRFAMVANGTTPVAEYSLDEEDYLDIGLEMLEIVNPENPYTISQKGENVYYCYTNENNITFFCVCDKSINEDKRKLFLNELQKHWILEYGNNADFEPYSKDDSFGENTIKLLLEVYNDPEKVKKLMEIKYNIYKVLKYTIDNLELALMRDSNSEQTIKTCNERLKLYKERMNSFTEEELSYFKHK